MNGKMGIALFFYHLNKVSKDKNHLAFANKLINDITSKLDYKIPRTFFDGLIGISWGIDHLIKSDFVLFEDDEILSELDKILLEVNVVTLMDESFSTGIRGIAYYVISRCSNKREIPKPFNREYINVLYDRLRQMDQREAFVVHLQSHLRHIVSGHIVEYDLNPFYKIIDNDPYDANLFNQNRNIGILNNGYTGIALRILRNMELKNEKNEKNYSY